MRRVLTFVTVLSMIAPSASVFAAPRAVQPQSEGSIAGSATSSPGRAMANATVRLRSVATGQLAGTTTSDAAGQFIFTGLPAGTYAVEVIDAAGQILGTSAAIPLAAGAQVTGVSVNASLAAAAAAASAGSFFSSKAGIVAVAVAGAAVAGVTIAATGTASPSR